MSRYARDATRRYEFSAARQGERDARLQEPNAGKDENKCDGHEERRKGWSERRYLETRRKIERRSAGVPESVRKRLQE